MMKLKLYVMKDIFEEQIKTFGLVTIITPNALQVSYKSFSSTSGSNIFRFKSWSSMQDCQWKGLPQHLSSSNYLRDS